MKTYQVSTLVVALSLFLSGTAVAMPDWSSPSEATVPVVQDDVRAPDQRTVDPRSQPDAIALIAPDQRTVDTRSQPDAISLLTPTEAARLSAPVVQPDGGLSALLIVLISVGGTLALVAMAYTVARARHAHGHAAI